MEREWKGTTVCGFDLGDVCVEDSRIQDVQTSLLGQKRYNERRKDSRIVPVVNTQKKMTRHTRLQKTGLPYLSDSKAFPGDNRI